MITSRDSFDAFVNAAWNFFNLPRVDELSGPYNLNDLYEYASGYNPQNIPPKNKLSGTELYGVMATFVQATIPKRIELQMGEDWPNLTAEADALVTYYNARDAHLLRRHYEDLPAKLKAERIDPRIPWLYGFQLDFRFR